MNNKLRIISLVLFFTIGISSVSVEVQAGIGGFLFRQVVEKTYKAVEKGKDIASRYLQPGSRQLSGYERELLRSGTQARVAGREVVKRNQTFDPHAVDALGRSNIQRMQQGLSPVGRDGRPVELHHMGQRNDGKIVELTNSEHRRNSADLHGYSSKSDIDRRSFSEWKRKYWQTRARDF